MDAIYIINLSKRNDRWRSVLSRMWRSGIKIPRIIRQEAVDGDSLVHEFWKLKENAECAIDSPGALGCLRSHVAVWKHARNNGYKTIMVLEDDVVFKRNVCWDDIFLRLWTDSYWTVAQLGSTCYQVPETQGWIRNREKSGSFAYCMRSTAFDICITEGLLEKQAVDMGPLKAASSVIFLWPPLAITTINDRGNICGVASTFKGVDYQQYDMMSCTNICLNMIVKNESHNLHRLFKSVFPFIDRYAIQDTGSTDDTVKQIQTWFQQGWNHYFPVEHGDTVQGIVEQTEWRGDFALHRNQALDIARTSGCEYVLIIDADEELVTENRYWWNDTERKDVACIAKRDGTIESWLPVIFRLRPGFASWKGFVHNDIVFSQPCQNVVVKEAYIAYRSDELSGAKSHRHKNAIEKYREDANRIRQAGKEDDPRMTFYLAKSLMDASDLDEALQIFSKRVRMGGFEEEVFLSYLYMASITWTRLSDGNEAQVISFIHKAIESCPRREIEALYFLVRFFRMTKRPWLAKLYCACALQCRVEFYPTLFVERRAYDQWSLWEELGVACAAVGSLHEARTAFNHALKNTPETTMKEKLVCNIQKIDAFISRDDYRYSA